MAMHCDRYDPVSNTQVYEFQFEPTTKKTLNLIEESFAKLVDRSDTLNRHIMNSSLIVTALPLCIVVLFVLFRWPNLIAINAVRDTNSDCTPRTRAKVITADTHANVTSISNESTLNVAPSLEGNVEDETRDIQPIEVEATPLDNAEDVDAAKVSRAQRRRARKARIKNHQPQKVVPEPEPETEPIEPRKRRKRKTKQTDSKKKRTVSKKVKVKKGKKEEKENETVSSSADKRKEITKTRKKSKAALSESASTSTTAEKKKKVEIDQSEKKEMEEVNPKESTPLPSCKPKPVSKVVANVFEAFYFENMASPDFADNSDSETSPALMPTDLILDTPAEHSSPQPKTDTQLTMQNAGDKTLCSDSNKTLDWVVLGLDDHESEHITNVAAIDSDHRDELSPSEHDSVPRPSFKDEVYSHSPRGDVSNTPFAFDARPSPTPTSPARYPLFKQFGASAPPRIQQYAQQNCQNGPVQSNVSSNASYYGGETRPNFHAMSMEAVLSISPPLTLRELVDCDLVHRFMRDQCGSRRLQSILNALSASECTSSISMLVAHLIGVNANLRFTAECVYGNYLMQMFFARGTERDRAAMLRNFVYASVLRLSRNKFGCRVMQKALTTVSLEQKLEILRHFREQFYAMRERSSALLCQHANHVLQVALEQDLPFAAVEFVRDELEANLSHFSGHVYACRVVQSMIKSYGDELEVALLMNESEREHNHLALSKSKYGNYVIQCIIAQKAWYSNLQRIYNFRMQLIRDVFEPQNLWDLSQDKHGSNVIETCIAAANQEQLAQLVACLCSTDRLQFEGVFLLRKMAVHQFANYVIKTLLDHCDEAMRRKIVLAIHRNVADLYEFDEYGGHGRYGYGDELLVKCKQLKMGFDRRSEKTVNERTTAPRKRRRQY